MSQAKRNEFRIAFDVCDEIEHLVCTVADAPRRLKNPHFSLCPNIMQQDAEIANGANELPQKQSG